MSSRNLLRLLTCMSNVLSTRFVDPWCWFTRYDEPQTWQDLTGREIKFMNIDVAKEYDLLLQLFKDYKPDTVRCCPLKAEDDAVEAMTS